MNNKALLIIDIQNDYFPGGKMELDGMDDAAKKAGELLASFRKKNELVVHVRHLSVRPGATFFIPETFGSEIHPSVAPQPTEKVILKNYPNSFRNTGFDDFLKENRVSELIVCGAMSHMCIDTSVRAAFDLGYTCTVISDACATRNLSFDGKTVEASNVHLAYMAALNGTFASVISLSEYLKKSREKA